MKRLRRLIILFFGVTVIGFTMYQVKNQAVKDTEAPEILCDSDTIEVKIDATDEELMSGMTAKDNRDGDVTDSLVVVSKSKFFEKGKRRVHYAAFDSKSNVATFTREMNYTNYKSPRFSLSSPLRFSKDVSETDLLQILRAEDCLDGDISGLIKIRYGENNLEEGGSGTRDVSFQVTNSAGDTVQLETKIEFLEDEEYKLPYPKLSEYLVYTKVNKELDLSQYLKGVINGGAEYLFEEHIDDSSYGTSYGDTYEAGDVDVTPEVDYSTPGVYTVRYTLEEKDNYGDTEKLGSTTLYVVVEE